MFEKQIVVDGKGHMLGRLASYIAKELLQGQRIVVVRCEGINISGSLFRTKMRFGSFLRKRMIHKPSRGVQHYRAPSKVFWRSIRGMIPHKTPKGCAAMGRLKLFEGVPAPYDTKKRLIIPDALKVIKMKDDRKFCSLGELCQQVGWRKKSLVEQLEEKRKIRSKKYYEKKVVKDNVRKKALNVPEVKKISAELAKYGY